MSRASRKKRIDALEKIRGSHIITYITSTRENLETQMAMDVIGPVFRQIKAISDIDSSPTIELFLHTNGGDGIVPWRLVTLIREYADAFNVLVPNRAFSAGTLTALGADHVVMHPMGMLGPTDATITTPFNPASAFQPNVQLGISVEDVTSYFALVKEDVGIHHEDELITAFTALTDKIHPLALGSVKRSTLQSKMMGEKLLNRRNDALSEHQNTEIVRKLTSELYFHGHPINRQEAKNELGLSFVEDADDATAEAMWDLYTAYAEDMSLDRRFDPVQEALKKAPLPVPVLMPGLPPTVSQQTVELGPFPMVYVESTRTSDSFEVEFEVAMTRDHVGNIAASVNQKSPGWTTSK